MDRQDRPLPLRNSEQGEPAELSEVLDITMFQQRLAHIRERNQHILEEAPQEWARKVADIQASIRSQRTQLEDALLDQMMSEEQAMLTRFADVERNLRNMIRLYRQLVDERNDMVTGLSTLHRWIREMEQKQGRHAHRDHGVDLTQKSFVEFLSKQAWLFDNSASWDLEQNPRRRRTSAGGD
jgi:hypothetical protein